MTAIIPIGSAQVSHFYGGTALPNGAAVTYGVAIAGSVLPGDMAAEIHDFYCDAICPVTNNTASIVSTRVKFGPNATGAFATFSDVRPGTLGGEPEPPNVAALVEKQTSSGGRAGRGRLYMPGLQTSQIEVAGVLNAGAFDDIGSAFNALFVSLSTAGYTPLLFHSASSDPTIVTSFQVDPVVATQRRRLR